MARTDRTGKLAVILHADVAGSTALVQRNEQLAHARIRETFQRFGVTIGKYHGQVRELRGDALLAEFERASDAVTASLAFQADQIEYDARLDDEIKPEVRVGIAMGEVIVADDTITGAGVVLAQRIEQPTKPGGVGIQGAAYETIPGRFPFEYESLGEHEVKGFDNPVRLYAARLKQDTDIPQPVPRANRRWAAGVAVAVVLVLMLALTLWFEPWKISEPTSGDAGITGLTGIISPGRRNGPDLPNRPSIAVLAFNNMSGDVEQDYFAEGIADDIITDLSKISGLLVIARNSSFVYKGSAVSVENVARELGVKYVLEGSVRRAGQQVRINAQLIDASTGGHIWAERYDGSLTNVFALQDRVRQKIVSALSVTLTAEEQASQGAAETSVPEAYDAFLKGWAHYQRNTPQDFGLARDYLEQALALDASYARAAAALAALYWDTHLREWQPALRVDAGAVKRNAYAYRDRALQSPTPLALVVDADMLMWRGKHDEAIEQARRATVLAPNDAYAKLELAEILVFAGRPKEALEYVAEAARLDPHGEPRQLYILGLAYFGLERYEDCAAALAKALELNPDFTTPSVILTSSLGHLGKGESAAESLQIYGSGAYWAAAGISAMVIQFPYKHSADRHRVERGLRLSGIKEY